ncbi:cytochrome b/b6 domain-containing protein [Rhodobacter ferrooxidans]|uniref:Cytochrome B561 n=1 Tax=Rhodobacter ferrooxidans TaxID=371731 RepID=C8S397_9RHOB|nr:cytochrome b/b6 domain-containing protein [Rhodobacter sp. SW2]EEW24579.1 cytochrome B561 [Rhodobacter sp. SW2]
MNSKAATRSNDVTATIRVWDPLVRLLHWSFVAAVAFAALTGLVLGSRWITPHVVVGTALGALLLIRLIWGVTGSATARFASFIVGPAALREHVAELRAGHAGRHLGHNPLGGYMILALLAVMAAVVVSGGLLLGGVFKAGPAKALISFDAAMPMRELHEIAAYGLLALVVLHVAGAVFESLRTRENLVRAMVTGRKEKGDAELHGSGTPRPVLTLLLVTLFVGGIGWLGASAMQRPIPNPPVQMAGTTYAAACVDCHMLYHPSLLPAASWQGLMTTLDDHFGEDASLDPATVDEITAWLVANAAETVDTKPAHMFAAVNPDSPAEITSTSRWQRIHDDLPEALFKSAAVKSRANCAACHTDAASGWFYPAAIDVPHEAAAQP